MDASSSAVPKNLHRANARFEQTVLLLQGGGALGSYQAGVYQALAERTCTQTGSPVSKNAKAGRRGFARLFRIWRIAVVV
jgi:hypothetical protein